MQSNTISYQDRLELITKLAALDKEFRVSLIENPKKILEEIGLFFPEDVNIIIFDTPKNSFGIALPPPLFD